MARTMTAVIKKEAAPGAVVDQAEIPSCGPDDLLLRVRATSICGTDLHIYNWNSWAQTSIHPPLVFGHEFTGEVVEVGRNVDRFRPGDFVSAESHIPCGRCFQCQNGQRHICDRVEILGIDRPGCFSEYVALPQICAWKNPKDMPVEVASILEPLGNAVHATNAVDVRGKTVSIFGCGPIGLFTLACCRAYQAQTIFAVDINPHRRAMARDLGATEVFDGADSHLRENLSAVDIAFEMSGHSLAITNALRSLKRGGTFVAFGLPSTSVEIDLANDVIIAGRRMVGIVGRRMFETWEEMQRLLEGARLDPTPVITHRFKLHEFDQAIRTMKSTDIKCGKVVLFP